MFYRNSKLWLTLLGLLAAPSFEAYAQGKLNQMQHIDEVVVVAKSYKEVIPAQHLTGKQLEKLSSHSVADALRYFAGVQIKDYGGMGGLKTVNVRNMGTHHVGVFYDGVQIGNAQNGVVDLGRFSLDDLEELSLYNGQKSDIFQSAKDFASGAAVYLRAKKPTFEKGKSSNFRLKYKTSTIQLVNPSFRWEKKVSDSASFSLSGEYMRSNGKYRFHSRRVYTDGTVAYDTSATRMNSDIETFRVEGGLYNSIFGGRLQTKVYAFGSKRGLPGACTKFKFYIGDRQDDVNIFGQSTFTKDVSSRYKYQVKAKFAYDYLHFRSLDSTRFMEEIKEVGKEFDNTYKQKEAYFSTSHIYDITNFWSISASTDIQLNSLEASSKKNLLIPFKSPRRFTGIATLATAVTINHLKVQASLLGTYVSDKESKVSQSPDKRDVSPGIFFGYTPFASTDLSLRAFYKHIFRMPTFNDLYYAHVGSSVLKPEHIDMYNVGFTYKKKSSSRLVNEIAVQADAYYLRTLDKIIAAPTGSQFRWMMSNSGKVLSKGVEASIAVQSQIGQAMLNNTVSYGYSDARDYSIQNGHKLSSYGDQIPYTPWHSGSIISTLSYRSWSFNYSFIYVGERYNGGVNNIVKNYVEPWYTHDCSIQKEFKLKHNTTINTSLEVNNALNQYYEVIYNYPMPGRNVRLVVSINI